MYTDIYSTVASDLLLFSFVLFFLCFPLPFPSLFLIHFFSFYFFLFFSSFFPFCLSLFLSLVLSQAAAAQVAQFMGSSSNKNSGSTTDHSNDSFLNKSRKDNMYMVNAGGSSNFDSASRRASHLSNVSSLHNDEEEKDLQDYDEKDDDEEEYEQQQPQQSYQEQQDQKLQSQKQYEIYEKDELGQIALSAAENISPLGHSVRINTIPVPLDISDPEIRINYIAEHENDVVEMQEFFRFSGLSMILSRKCAERSILLDANSPKKLYKYVQEVKGFSLMQLGIDEVDSELVFETLNREFGGSSMVSLFACIT